MSTFSAEDESNLLVVVVDVNPIWWGQQAQREPEVELQRYSSVMMFFILFILFHTKQSSFVRKVHLVEVSGCSHGDWELPPGNDQDKQAGCRRKPLSRQVTVSNK